MRSLPGVRLQPSLRSLQQDPDIPVTVGYIENYAMESFTNLSSEGNMQPCQGSHHRRDFHPLKFRFFQNISGKPFQQIMRQKAVKQKGLNPKIVFCPKIFQKKLGFILFDQTLYRHSLIVEVVHELLTNLLGGKARDVIGILISHFSIFLPSPFEIHVNGVRTIGDRLHPGIRHLN